MKKSIIALLLLSMLFSCKKDEPKQYSTWYVNGQKFTTNEVFFREIKGISYLRSQGKRNRFYIQFNTISLPKNGDFLTKCDSLNRTHCCVTLLYSSRGYYSSQKSILHATVTNKKIQYTLDSTWFYIYGGGDSILVKGTFNEP